MVRVAGWRITDLSIAYRKDAPFHIHISCSNIERDWSFWQKQIAARHLLLTAEEEQNWMWWRSRLSSSHAYSSMLMSDKGITTQHSLTPCFWNDWLIHSAVLLLRWNILIMNTFLSTFIFLEHSCVYFGKTSQKHNFARLFRNAFWQNFLQMYSWNHSVTSLRFCQSC